MAALSHAAISHFEIRTWVRCALAAAAIGWHTEARAIYKCIVDGTVTFQDMVCEEDRETLSQEAARKAHYASMYRKLDQLAAQGHGMVKRQAASTQIVKPKAEDRDIWSNQCDAASLGYQDCVSTKWEMQTERNNARSAAALTSSIETMKDACGGMLFDYPSVGMSDETFRKCTIHARFNRKTQIVVSEDGEVPLQLYIFSTDRASRVYLIGGVVTEIRP
jgi:hypothetical protein